LREIHGVAVVCKHREEQERLQVAKPEENYLAEEEGVKERSSDIAISDTERTTFSMATFLLHLHLKQTSEMRRSSQTGMRESGR
jgi:hypothetical protein